MIPVPASYEGRRVGVLGLGRSGLAAAKALREAGAAPICWDDGEAGRAAAEALGLPLDNLGGDRLWSSDARPELLLVSPGIPNLYPRIHPAIARAFDAGVPVDNDVGLFFESWLALDFDDRDEAPPVICVTGSNGKSTTTALIAHLLTGAGRPTQAGGNIGRAVFDLDIPEEGGALVLELSSYQLELARRLAPDVASFINLSPDHLDRHGGQGGYFAAKARLFTLGAPEHAVVGVDQPEGRFLADRCLGQGGGLVRVASGRKALGRGREVIARKGFLSEMREGRQAASVDLRGCPALQGAHNHQNAAQAWAVCRALGLAPKALEKGLHSFPGLPHRMERVGEAGGVLFVNDSKATNADAAEKALLTYDKVRWIVGGVPKAGGIDVLHPLFGRLAGAYLIGEAAGLFGQTLEQAAPHIPASLCGSLDAALDRAAAEAQPGEVVLLSPACASFDQFASFEARGDAFRARALGIIARMGGACAAGTEEA